MSRMAIAALLMAACSQPPPDESSMYPDAGPWRLVWSDEFDAPADTPPDPARWAYDVGGHGWGNEQLEFNTDLLENAHHDGSGSLRIVAMKKQYGSNEYTSARIRTQGLFERAYGKFEARMRLPYGRGIWPAFWLLGSDLPQVGWPECGEIDIMEARGDEPSTNHGSAHGPGYSGDNPFTARYDLPGGQRFADGFHVFSIEWEPGRVRWFIDGDPYHVITEAGMPEGKRWVFDSPMFIILDLAVGGLFSGDPDETTVFPQLLEIDWVRVWEPAR